MQLPHSHLPIKKLFGTVVAGLKSRQPPNTLDLESTNYKFENVVHSFRFGVQCFSSLQYLHSPTVTRVAWHHDSIQFQSFISQLVNSVCAMLPSNNKFFDRNSREWTCFDYWALYSYLILKILLKNTTKITPFTSVQKT